VQKNPSAGGGSGASDIASVKKNVAITLFRKQQNEFAASRGFKDERKDGLTLGAVAPGESRRLFASAASNI